MRWLALTLLCAAPAFAQVPQCEQKPVSVVKDPATGQNLVTYRCAPTYGYDTVSPNSYGYDTVSSNPYGYDTVSGGRVASESETPLNDKLWEAAQEVFKKDGQK